MKEGMRLNKKRQKGGSEKAAKNGQTGLVSRLLSRVKRVKEEIFPGSPPKKKTGATELLRKDHRRFKSLIKKLKSARKNKAKLLDLIEGEVKIHSRCEEMIFYPEMNKVDSALIAESLEEHHQVDILLAELKKMTRAGAEKFKAKVVVLEENLDHHIEEEEGDMFIKAELELRDQLESLAEEIVYYKGQLKAKWKAA